MSDEFEGSYEVDDGYVGKSRPQHFKLYQEDLYVGMEEDDFREIFDDGMEADFEQSISCSEVNYEAFVEWAKEIIESLDD